MSDWSQGYPTESSYMDAIQVEMNPRRWQQAMMFANFRCPDPSKPFRFLELGCGSANTLIALAACYPHAEFVGYDFMPEHIVAANALIKAAGLENVQVIEGSFGEMAKAPPEQKFDFASAHGVWAWVPDAVKGEIVEVLGSWMAPGAVAYFGYNAAAGWAAADPIRQIFRRAPRSRGDGSFSAARKGVSTWLDMQGETVPHLKALWTRLSESNDQFLEHEIASPNGKGIWLEEIEGPLNEAKMAFAGPAVLAEHMDAIFLEDVELEFLRSAVSEGWGETAKDLLHCRTFRNDLFHRGAPRISGTAMVAEMRKLRLTPWDTELQLGTHPSVHGNMVRGLEPELVAGLQSVVNGGTGTFGDCMDAIEADPMQAFQAVMMAYVSGALLDLRSEAETEAARPTCDRFNDVIRERLNNGVVIQGMASPAYGGSVQFIKEEQFDVLTGKSDDPVFAGRLDTLGIAAP